MDKTAEAVEAIRSGDVACLSCLLDGDPVLATERVDGARTLLHVATDWPGHFPNVKQTIATLITHGADVNAAFRGRHSETPLHWAASSDDLEALDALLDHNADIEAAGSVIGGGSPLADAVAFGQWSAARRLIERGARTMLWQAAALGLLDRVEEFFRSDTAPTRDEITNAFWCACHGGQLPAAQYLLTRGADMNWVGHDGLTAFDAAKRSGSEDAIRWLGQLGAQSSKV